MKGFSGFPSRSEYVAIPKAFFSDILPYIEDPAELTVSLHLFRLLGSKRGYPRAVLQHEALEDRALAAGFARNGRDSVREGARGLELAVGIGTFLRAATPEGEGWVLLNTGSDRRAAAALANGRLRPESAGGPPAAVRLPERDIYTLY